MLAVVAWGTVALVGATGLILGESHRAELGGAGYDWVRIASWALLIIGGLLAVRAIAEAESAAPSSQPASTESRMKRTTKAAIPFLVLAAAFVVSDLAGKPETLPRSALGWLPLLYLERAAALPAGIGVVWLIGWRALHGRFPIKFGNVEYEDEVESSAEVADTLEKRMTSLEATVRDLAFADAPPGLVESDPETV